MSDLYIYGAAVIDNVLAQKGSLKGLVMAEARQVGQKGAAHSGSTSRETIDAKRLLALTANTLAYHKPLAAVLATSNVLDIEKRVFSTARNLQSKDGRKSASAKSLALVLAHDLLLTKRGRIATSPAWPPHAALQRHGARLRAELVKLQIKEGKQSVQDLRAGQETRTKAARIPRWVRINERKATVQDVMELLQAQGWSQGYEASELAAKAKTFVRSRHVLSVLAFHPAHTSWLIQHELYKNGSIMLQDLASCFPAEILIEDDADADKEVHAVDATSAPGNKTSHLSARLSRLQADSDIVAMEHVSTRYKTLVEQLRRAGAFETSLPGFVTSRLCDFMQQDPHDYANVTHMLLDPSCSGSGILGRLDFLTEEQDEGADDGSSGHAEQSSSSLNLRLQNLASFQQSMIEHAMQFPALTRLTYSTCSIHHEENEDVVMRVLSSDMAKEHGWRLAQRDEVMPSWPTRGLVDHCRGDARLAEAMVRCVPGGASGDVAGLDMDATNGFFVALFVRNRERSEEATQVTTTSHASNSASNTIKNRKRKQRAKEKMRAEKQMRRESTTDQ